MISGEALKCRSSNISASIYDVYTTRNSRIIGSLQPRVGLFGASSVVRNPLN